MRKELFFNPRLLCERLAMESVRRRRLARLRGGPAAGLMLGHIDTLELLELCRPYGIHTLYDIGANVGTWSLLAKAIYPDAVVHAFEPLPACREPFQRRMERVNGVMLHSVALGRKNGSAEIFVGAVTDTASLFRPGWRLEEEVGQTMPQPVPVRRLDDYVREKGIASPDLIKLDVQGYEIEVLEGAVECLRETRAVICEVSFVPLYEGQCLFADVVAFMAEHGFSVFAFGECTVTGRPITQADLLFTRQPS